MRTIEESTEVLQAFNKRWFGEYRLLLLPDAEINLRNRVGGNWYVHVQIYRNGNFSIFTNAPSLVEALDHAAAKMIAFEPYFVAIRQQEIADRIRQEAQRGWLNALHLYVTPTHNAALTTY